jgi:UTP:GlnB (protein PII) uridylyltransferase
MAADEYRVEVDIHESVHGRLSERLRTLDLDDEVAERLGDRVIVTRDGEKLYVYAQSAEGVGEAERVVREVLTEENLEGATRRRRWNPAERFWQDADEPLAPADEDTPPDPAETATNKDLPHPLFVYIEGHEPEFLRDLGV